MASALSMGDLLSAFYKNGVFLDNPDQTAMALAVFSAESSRIPTNHNYCCWGIAQINVKAHYSKIPGNSLSEKQQWLTNVDNNLNFAWQLFNSVGKHWSPTWSAATNGSYRKFLTEAKKTVASTPSAGEAPPGGLGLKDGLDIGGFLSAIAAGFGWITDPHNWLRMGTFLGGLVILVLAAGSLLSQTNIGAAVLSKGKSFAQGSTKAAS